ncbi:NIF3-like protein 1, partial [Fragariocoptes setiger]
MSLGSGGGAGGGSSDTPYRQKYKRAWELDIELRDWIQPCQTDAHAAWCKYCRSKLHAHKKGLLAHSRSAKHKKHVLNPANEDHMDTNNDQLLAFANDSYSTPPSTVAVVVNPSGATDDSMSAETKSRLIGRRSGLHQFQESWLSDPLFSVWVRRIPNNLTKALCIACRCVITAGRSELLKHSQSAKHKKSVLAGPFEELSDMDLEWLDQAYTDTNAGGPPGGSVSATVLNIPSVASYQPHHHQAYHNTSLGIRGAGVFETPGIMLDQVLAQLQEHVPLNFAESWDNVGIMVQPTQAIKVHNILLTIDLNESIVEEALRKRVQLIISYHPPIFKPLKRLVPKNWKEKALLMCIEHRIAVYSPHTALDAIKGGINDWLLAAFSPNVLIKTNSTATSASHSVVRTRQAVHAEHHETTLQGQHNGDHSGDNNEHDNNNVTDNAGTVAQPLIEQHQQPQQQTSVEQQETTGIGQAGDTTAPMEEEILDRTRPIKYSRNKTFTASLELMLTDQQDSITQALQDIDNVMMTVRHNTDFGGTDVRLSCAESTLPDVLDVLHQHPYAQLCSRVTHLVPTPIPGVGMGRLLTLKSPLPLYEVVHRTKQHLDQTNVRLGLSPRHTRDTKVTRIAVCAGSGASILQECVGQADVWITGEMSHHDVLDATRSGATVILCEHSNSERGFLRHWSGVLKTDVFGEAVNVIVSGDDRDPLRIV